MLLRFLIPIVSRDCDNSLVLNKTSTWKSFCSVQEVFIYYNEKENHQHNFGHLIKMEASTKDRCQRNMHWRQWQMKRQRLAWRTYRSHENAWMSQHCVMVSLDCQLDWLARCLGGQWSTPLGVTMKAFPQTIRSGGLWYSVWSKPVMGSKCE